MTNTPLDKLLNGGIEKGVITNIYGPAGSGKSNIALCVAMKCAEDGKAIYVDTESSFSMERFRQLGGTDKMMKNIVIVEPHSWEEQHREIIKLSKIENIRLIVVDSIVVFYRLELNENNFQVLNKQLATQYSVLSGIARKHKIAVLVTNQVYGFRDGAEEKIEMTSRAVAKYWSKALIELKKLDKYNCRVAIVRKHRSLPEGKSIEFEIAESKLKEIGKLGIF